MKRSLYEASTSKKKCCHTKYEKRQGSLTWKIGGFSLCSLGNSKCLKSSPFGINGDFEIWGLELYPNGMNEESREFISVRLMSLYEDEDSSDDESVSKHDKNMTCSISVVDVSGEKVHAMEFIYREENQVTKYISRKDLLGSEKLLPDDQLTVSCVLTVTNRTKSTSGSMNSKRPRMNSRIAQRNLTSDLANLLNRETHSDVLLKVGDQEFRAHKALLATRSSTFESMFRNPMVESATNTVTISDVDADVMKELLSFVYTDSCSYSSIDFALKILSAADKYDVSALKSHCADYLSPNVSADSVFQVLVSADAHGVARLRQKCIDFICRELSYLVTVFPNWKSQFNSCPNLLCAILEQLSVSPHRDTDKDM